jgi:hypothetical protein
MVNGVPATHHEMRSQLRRRGKSKLAVVAIPGPRHELSYLDRLQPTHASDSRFRRRKRALSRTNPGKWGTHPHGQRIQFLSAPVGEHNEVSQAAGLLYFRRLTILRIGKM